MLALNINYCGLLYNNSKLLLIFHSASVPSRNSKYGRSQQPVEYGGLNCRGNEITLQSCGVSGGFVGTWSQLLFSNRDDYAGVECIDKTVLRGKDVSTVQHRFNVSSRTHFQV